MAEYTLSPSQSEDMIDDDALTDDENDDELCGAELDRGGTCDRLKSECPYHG